MTRTIREVTPVIPWKFMFQNRTAKPTVTLGNKHGGWARRHLVSAIDPRTILGYNINTLLLSPYIESCNVNVRQQFNIVGYRGPQNNLERIALVSCTTGGYTVSLRCDGNAVVTSGKYCDHLSVVSSYGHSIDRFDYKAANGRSYMSFDLQGVSLIGIYFTELTGRAFMEISGF